MSIKHSEAPVHGGQLHKIAAQYAIAMEQWLDLSTGIAPFSYPIPVIPAHVWQDLPCISQTLIETAKNYYQAQYCWPLSGSQHLIEKLPQLWQAQHQSAQHVYLPKVGYKEHQQAWKVAGYQLHFYQTELPKQLEHHAVVVVINPNNPLTDHFSIAHLKQLQQALHEVDGLLVIDEAFADILPAELSFVAHLQGGLEKKALENVIILRSFGKFFGLAGIRIGFVCSGEIWHQRIKHSVGPWSVNGPALYIAGQALQDCGWQQTQKARLLAQMQKQRRIIEQFLPCLKVKSNALFITVFLNDAPAIYELLCLNAVYVRLTDEKDALRFGIADSPQLKTLQRVLAQLKQR